MKLRKVDADFENKLEAIIDEAPQVVSEIIENEIEVFKDYEKPVLISNLINYYKENNSDLEKFDAEIKRLQESKKTLLNRNERIKNYIAFVTEGKKIKEVEYSISYRKSESIEIIEESIPLIAKLYPDAVAIDYKVSKTKLKEYIKNGFIPEGVSIIEKESIIIK